MALIDEMNDISKKYPAPLWHPYNLLQENYYTQRESDLQEPLKNKKTAIRLG